MTPIVLDPAPPPRIERKPLGWVLLAAILGLLLFSSVYSYFSPRESRRTSFTQERREFKSAIEFRESDLRFGTKRPADKETFAVPFRVSSAPEEIIEAVRLRVVISAENSMSATQADLARLQKSRDKDDQRLAKLYGAPKPSKDLARSIAAELPDSPIELRVAKAYAGRLSGKADAYAGFADRGSITRRGAVVISIVLVLVGGIVAWCVVFGLRREGHLPEPFRQTLISAETADRLAGKAGFVLLGYLVLNQILAGMPPGFTDFARPIGLILLVPAILWAPFLGGSFSLADIGISGANLGQNVRLGLFFLLLELPVSFIAAMVGTQVFKFLPAQHPSTEQVMNSPTPLVILTVMLSACIAAPFCEEIVFRGLFLPAFQRLTSFTISLVVTSVCFALLHPQGPGLWAALASVGAFSCLAVRYTRSLVPSIVMHFGHNFLILMLGLAFGG